LDVFQHEIFQEVVVVDIRVAMKKMPGIEMMAEVWRAINST
jgi:hypothetical protein